MLRVVFLDELIIKMRDLNTEVYESLHEGVKSKFEYIGNPILDEDFKKTVSKCMKGECSRLHKLYTTRLDHE